MLISVLLGLTFFSFVYYNKELQVHPMKLIMFMTLAESAVQFALLAQFYICTTGANKLFNYTVFFNSDDFTLARSTIILSYSSMFVAFLCVNLSIVLNTMLCLDLILMVRYPFAMKENRL